MASDLPSDFDIVVLGTGLQESILAAAFSRIGLKVLHIDRNDYYGGPWASFNLQGVDKWIIQKQSASFCCQPLDSDHLLTLVKEGEKLLELPGTYTSVLEPQSHYHVDKRPEINEEKIAEDTQDMNVSIQRQENNNTLPQSASSEYDGEKDKPGQKPSVVETAQSKEGALGGGSKEGTTAEESVAKDFDGQFSSASEEDGESADTPTVDKETSPSDVVDYIPTKDKQERQCEWFADDICKEWRRYSIDLAPKLLYCAGSMVELLIVSDVAKYCEFRTVSRVLTMHDGKLEKVPCSRADVFSSKILTLPEKRLLMKFLTFAAEYEQHSETYQDYLDRPFADFLDSQKLTTRIKHFVMEAIAMVLPSSSTQEGLASTQKFLRSLGRYGNTAFLFPLYGSGELPQGFCRLSAVFGGCYCLTLSALHLVITEADNRCIGIITNGGQRINCKYLIGDPSYMPSDFYIHDNRNISRGIFVTDRTIFPGAEEELSLLYLLQHSEENATATTVLELPSSAMVCQGSTYLVHLTCSARADAATDLKPAANTLFDMCPQQTDDCAEVGKRKPRVLWSLFFKQVDLSNITATEKVPENLFIVCGPGAEIDPDKHVAEARKIFKKICPDEEFLPKPPHPDDIIFVDDEETPATGNQSSVLSADLDVDGEGVDCTESKQIQRDAKEEATESESVTESNVTENTEEGQEKSEKK
ncbi:rab proteins geranylgeranyltransferase component A 2-like isoform X2 [Pomacea canaliculata]|uniref:rab proteins geranylgeranyltransferase component A 2-like isoform X2 n=1 Tax=Pomacea canaliculata TaxID=400727 RepID=UPI000D7384C8|nr:rab proteins geranylgeranyltransferase component A 2-like isoform X2 [Pomacea canaliculata]